MHVTEYIFIRCYDSIILDVYQTVVPAETDPIEYILNSVPEINIVVYSEGNQTVYVLNNAIIKIATRIIED